MLETLPRPFVVITAIVAVVAISVGIKDYVQERKNPPASTPTPSIIDSKAVTVKNKTGSAKTRRARISMTEATAAARTRASADMEKTQVSEEFPSDGAKTGALTDNALEAVTAQAADAEIAAGMDANNGVRNKRDSTSAFETADAELSAIKCVPLPNVTKPGDADAPYYQNWAREYSCVF
jgi:hypothetical protein